MKERPILFSAPMVRAILDGSKTQTRRVVKPQPYIDEMGNACWNGSNFGQSADKVPHFQGLASPIPSSKTKRVHCPYGKPGDRLWVRESGWERPDRTAKMMREGADTWPRYAYAADGWSDQDRADFKAWGFKPRPSIHMPRWASRITLEVTRVRVERVGDISEEDARAEGVEPMSCSCCERSNGGCTDGPMGRCCPCCNGTGIETCAVETYEALWDEINGAGSFAASPWVWVYDFRRVG